MKTGRDNNSMVGVILAAGRGLRAYPSTRLLPKVLFRVAGETLLERNIKLMRDQLSTRNIIIIIGHLGQKIREYLGDMDLGVQLSFVEQPEPRGIGDALLLVENYIDHRRLAVILGDELYINSNHKRLLDYQHMDFDAVVAFRQEKNRTKISKNFSGHLEDGRVLSLREKPKWPDTDLMGVGTYLLNEKVFRYIRETPPSELRGEVEITDVLSNMARHETVLGCILEGGYINVTSTEDINLANYAWRDKHFDGYKVSVIIPAYNEEETIAHVVNDYKCHEAVDEVLVVDNNSQDRTSEVARKAGARIVVERKQGYGHALRRGMDEAEGDILVLTEADGSFRAKDIQKFLEYLKECDLVMGTRTTRQMIEQGANMDPLLRWGNVFVGKLVQILWWNRESRYTDVGCTYRAIWRTSYEQIRPLLHGAGPEFSPEMMIAVLLCRQRVIEIPVSYYRRIGGESKHSKNIRGASKTALKMLRLILKYWSRSK
jgi:dTDP-glucose pyrophosphorylase